MMIYYFKSKWIRTNIIMIFKSSVALELFYPISYCYQVYHRAITTT